LTENLRETAVFARAAANTVLDLVPEGFEAQISLGRALAMSREDEAAVPHYQRCIRLSPRSAGVYHVYGGLSVAHLSAGDYEESLRCARLAVAGDTHRGGGKALDFYPVIPASLALLGRIDEAKAAWKRAGAHASRSRMRHTARFTGERLDALVEGLRLAGWDGMGVWTSSHSPSV
jgi:tetratricopeptide (TPR) repeat protein